MLLHTCPLPDCGKDIMLCHACFKLAGLPFQQDHCACSQAGGSKSAVSALQGGVLVALTSRTPTMSCIWSQVLSLPIHQVQFHL